MADFSIDELVRIYREEKVSREMTELPDDFYLNVGRYISQLNLELKRGDSLRQELIKEELKSIVNIVQEIHLSRVLKAINSAAQGDLPAPLIDRERHAFGEVRQSLEKLQSDLIQPVISGKVALAAPPDLTNTLLILLADIPEKIIGVDLKNYGPFVRGEVASLPSPNAEILLKHGVGRKVEVKI
jgi:DNA replication initiation complex subunit (GINS family)